jgi:hypothetical protein
MQTSLEGKRVLVTAGAAGIGRAIAQTFLEHGARVHVCDIDQAALARLKSELPRATQTRADVSSVADVDRLFDDVARSLGGLDVLVNNAGIAGPTAKVEDIRPEDWERCIAVDLNGMFYCTRRAMPMLKAAGGGSIINLSSIAGRLGFPLRTPYAAAKWAVVGFTESEGAGHFERGDARPSAPEREPAHRGQRAGRGERSAVSGHRSRAAHQRPVDLGLRRRALHGLGRIQDGREPWRQHKARSSSPAQ